MDLFHFHWIHLDPSHHDIALESTRPKANIGPRLEDAPIAPDAKDNNIQSIHIAQRFFRDIFSNDENSSI